VQPDDDQLCVLVIDDEPQMAQMIAKALLKLGHQVVTAETAEEGLEQLPYYTFQVAFIDHRLPRMQGLVLGEYLRKNNPDMKIALITGETDPELKKESEKLGVTFIAKPFDISELTEVINSYITESEERKKQRSLQANPDFAPNFTGVFGELAEYFSLPKPPDRIGEQLERRIKDSLNSLSADARYTERDRAAALAGLLAARVLGISLKKRRDGTSLYEYYDRLMSQNGLRTEFGGEPD